MCQQFLFLPARLEISTREGIKRSERKAWCISECSLCSSFFVHHFLVRIALPRQQWVTDQSHARSAHWTSRVTDPRLNWDERNDEHESTATLQRKWYNLLNEQFIVGVITSSNEYSIIFLLYKFNWQYSNQNIALIRRKFSISIGFSFIFRYLLQSNWARGMEVREDWSCSRIRFR